ncbi:MAG: hypothetical protein SCM11_13765 [Bacillota bacterium]|nr:hypothetical protein [Bacillota bacterium]
MPLKLKNFNIRQFNRDVNRSQDPDAQYLRWAAYRQQIGELVSESRHRSIVLGAGALNDVDLALLCSLSGFVVLADIDMEAVLQGIERQELPTLLRKKIEVVQHDFSGAHNARLFERLVAVVQRQAPVAMVIVTLAEILADMKPVPLLPGQSFDLVFSCPVYTQLVYTQIEVLLKILHAAGLYAYDELNQILLAAHQGMQAVLRHYNDLMLSLLGPDGRLVVLADIIELQADDPLLAVLTAKFADTLVDSARIRTLLDEHGLELALSGLADLEARLDKPESSYFLWPFDASKSYVVQSLAGRRKDGI